MPDRLFAGSHSPDKRTKTQDVVSKSGKALEPVPAQSQARNVL